jgi:hypothetical protein
MASLTLLELLSPVFRKAKMRLRSNANTAASRSTPRFRRNHQRLLQLIVPRASSSPCYIDRLIGLLQSTLRAVQAPERRDG